ncbi:MAG: glutamyl-tRNA reductase [Gammaproteobacteria bacterium]|jgi:glutamyl-tRNA reductase|nr:glutamyl-tRNA reductase [Gammaproteobacteria bacterium]MDP6097030.1 glutamyl-tRNA reductase [Gammaproteobacteria bacterium]MDP7456119.1 glutamyl-tRNA reductase [Gammaproteobacteria bacterium]HJO12944.1 glutamyl-tRNA reductase [Gammaproteobacteria bacterium]|tara:strand:+ start:637 stop:1956 length:1320 start_codon:yes stop_codon:yes gene_type:complete
MALVLLGINHNTASIDLREKVAFPPEIVGDAINQLIAIDHIAEVIIVSTCNRTELYLETSMGETPNNGVDESIGSDESVAQQRLMVDWLAGYHQLSADELMQCSYCYWQEDVVRHLMKVSCGLDSMVLGEPQILGQIKSAFAVSRELNAVGVSLGRAFEEAFSIAKEVRTDTAIGENPVSVAYAAVALAERIFSNLSSLSILLIGAGRTIELVARHLADKGVHQIAVANRTLDHALELARKFDAHGALLSDIPEQLVKVDIVISSTNSQLPLLGKGAVERALKQRRHKPMLLVDLAVPRDIEVEVGEIADAYLFSVDDISEVIEDNVKSRAEAAHQAHSIIERGVEEYQSRLRSLNAVTTLRAFREKAETIRDTELQRAVKALEKGETADKVVEGLARAITNKLIHSPSVQMKKASSQGRDELLQLIQELYELSDQDKD